MSSGVFSVAVSVSIALVVIALRRRPHHPAGDINTRLGALANPADAGDPTEIMAAAVTEAVAITRSQRGAYLAAGDGTPVVIHESVAGTIDLTHLDRGVVSRALTNGVAGRAITNEEVFGTGVVAALAVPIASHEMIVGVLVVTRAADEPYSLDDLALLVAFAPTVAEALHASYLSVPDEVWVEPAVTDADGTDAGYASSIVGDDTGDAAAGEVTAAAMDERPAKPVTSLSAIIQADADRRAETHRETDSVPSLAIVLIDVDHLAILRAGHGQLAAARLLGAVAEVVQANVRGVDRVERDRPDGFRIVLVQASEDEAAEVCERLRAAVATTPFDGAEVLPGERVTVSVGVALADHDDLARLQVRADEALQAAKQAGRNRVVLVAA